MSNRLSVTLENIPPSLIFLFFAITGIFLFTLYSAVKLMYDKLIMLYKPIHNDDDDDDNNNNHWSKIGTPTPPPAHTHLILIFINLMAFAMYNTCCCCLLSMSYNVYYYYTIDCPIDYLLDFTIPMHMYSICVEKLGLYYYYVTITTVVLIKQLIFRQTCM